MMNVLELVMQEDQTDSAYLDEKAASNLYCVSFSYALKSLEGMQGEEKEKRTKKNEWLKEETNSAEDVPVLNFDHIVRQLKNERCTCDALFYNTDPNPGEQHYLAEFKNAGKKTVLGLLDDLGRNGIYNKVCDSVHMIQNELVFGGVNEHEELTIHMHFFLVYAGKNDVPSPNTIVMPGKMRVSHDNRGKQKNAGRMKLVSDKAENEIYERFGDKLEQLGLESCEESVFPGKALPFVKKIKGGGKKRRFSIFSSRDFAQIIDAGFFDGWKWGSYSQYFRCQA